MSTWRISYFYPLYFVCSDNAPFYLHIKGAERPRLT
jgi:hypothetical protein